MPPAPPRVTEIIFLPNRIEVVWGQGRLGSSRRREEAAAALLQCFVSSVRGCSFTAARRREDLKMLAERPASPKEGIRKGKRSEEFLAVSLLCLPLPHLPSSRLCTNKGNQPCTKCFRKGSVKITGFPAYLSQLEQFQGIACKADVGACFSDG